MSLSWDSKHSSPLKMNHSIEKKHGNFKKKGQRGEPNFHAVMWCFFLLIRWFIMSLSYWTVCFVFYRPGGWSMVILITRWEVTSLGWSHPPSDTFLTLNHATFCLSFQKCEFYVIDFCAIDMSWRCRERLLEGIWVLAVDICRQKKGGGVKIPI